jgi:hypothetical protein
LEQERWLYKCKTRPFLIKIENYENKIIINNNLCTVVCKINAQEKTNYGFAYAYYDRSYEQKIVYFTNTVSGKCTYLSYSSSYECPQGNSLSIQWHKKLETIVNETFRYRTEIWAWHENHAEVEEYGS